MATVQVQKSTTKTAIDQKQSLEIVQTMLHGGISTVSYLRSLFDERAFVKQAYEMSDQVHSYSDYASAKLTEGASEAKKERTNMEVLRRGYSRRVDILLSWLEKGVFPALKAGHLQALEVYVHPDRNDRQKVLETYTFTVNYAEIKDTKHLAGIQLDGPKSAPVTIEATNSALQTLVRDLGHLCSQLPALPRSRFISMEMFYLPAVQKVPKAPGFEAGTDEKMLFASASGWKTHTKILSALGSAFHPSTLAITSLAPARILGSADGTTLSEPPAYPSKLQFKAYPKAQAAEYARPVARVFELPRGEDDISETVTPSTIVEPTATQKVPGTPLLGSQLFDSMNTQSSNVHGIKQAFGRMMHPEINTQGDTQIQSMMQPLPAPRTETTRSPICTTSSFKPLKAKIVVPGEKAVLTKPKAERLAQEASQLRSKGLQSAKSGGWTRKKGKANEPVNCQCGHFAEEEDMVCCVFCDTWQHLPCYGYTAADDPRMPDEHVCYQCLLGDDEQMLMEKLKELAMRRRAMDFALLNGVGTLKQFAKDMGLQAWQATPVYQHLKSMKYIVEASGSLKPGYGKTGKPLFVAARSGEEHEDMMQQLFNPTLHIEHHYHLPSKPMRQSSLGRRLLDKGAGKDLPAPATPVAQLRKRNATTPASGLDPRESVTPYQTPSRAPTLPQKRAMNNDIDVETPAAKKNKMPTPGIHKPKSARTTVLLDANGEPSSPAFAMPELR